MRRSLLLVSSISSSFLHPSPVLRQCGPAGCGGGGTSNIDAFAKILSQAQTHNRNSFSPSSSNSSASEYFTGQFAGGDAALDPGLLRGMHARLQRSLTPEMQDAMRAAMAGLQRGEGLPAMGMMAFGVGENEKGKKVARGAKMVFNPNTGKFEKDFVEQQLEEDDAMLPKETVGDYRTEGSIEVEFEEDMRKEAGKVAEKIPEVEVVVEETSSSSSKK